MITEIFNERSARVELARAGRSSFLVVGNHVERGGVAPRGDEYAIVINGNANKVPPGRMDMAASFMWLPGDAYPCGSFLWTISYPCHADAMATLGRDRVFILDPLNTAGSFKDLGYANRSHPPGPTTGFSVLRAMEAAKAPVRVAGFSWYMDDEESKIIDVHSHNPMKERAYARMRLMANPLFTFTDECLKYLKIGV